MKAAEQRNRKMIREAFLPKHPPRGIMKKLAEAIGDRPLLGVDIGGDELRCVADNWYVDLNLKTGVIWTFIGGEHDDHTEERQSRALRLLAQILFNLAEKDRAKHSE